MAKHPRGAGAYLPAIGPMAAETIGYGYDDNGLTVGMGGNDSCLSWMEYTHLGQPLRAHMGVTPNQITEHRVLVAASGPADQRDGHARHPRLAS